MKHPSTTRQIFPFTIEAIIRLTFEDHSHEDSIIMTARHILLQMTANEISLFSSHNNTIFTVDLNASATMFRHTFCVFIPPVFYPPCSCTWNSLLKQLRQPSAPPSLVTATDSTPPLALSSHQFHSQLKTFLFEQSFPP